MAKKRKQSLDSFAGRALDSIKKEIQALYAQNDTPWVIGYSGGKDSTTVTQLVYLALLDLPTRSRHKKVYVLSSDTKVETPAIVNHIDINLGMCVFSANWPAIFTLTGHPLDLCTNSLAPAVRRGSPMRSNILA